jgi:hypothetical protein
MEQAMYIDSLPFDFVISYNHEDSAIAYEVMAMLENLGLHGWSDVRYCVKSSVSIENQVAIAWEKSRFIIVLVTTSFRDSHWCHAEYMEGIASENAIPLTRLLVLYDRDAIVPGILCRHPRFSREAPDNVCELARYIRNRRQCTEPRKDFQLAANRWQECRRAASSIEGLVSSRLLATICSVDLVCEWFAAHEKVSLDVDSAFADVLAKKSYDGEFCTIDPEPLLSMVFSDALEADAIPFGTIFFRAALEVIYGSESGESDLRRTVASILWNQLLVLTLATNRFFLTQMLEVAESIAELFEFTLLDEGANSHFLAVAPEFWEQAIGGIIQSRDLRELLDSTSNLPLSSTVEHVALSHWHRTRTPNFRLTNNLRGAERIHLAGMNCLRTLDSWIEPGQAQLPSDHATVLGLNRSAMASNIDPNLAVEIFANVVDDVIGGTVLFNAKFGCLHELARDGHPISGDLLEALHRALYQVVVCYREAIGIWSNRIGESVSFSRALVDGCSDSIIGPYRVLLFSDVEVSQLRIEVVKLLERISVHSNEEARRVADVIERNMDHPELRLFDFF